MSGPGPRVIVIAGPNGAGKTTHAQAVLATLGIRTFVNADYIARGLSGRDTEAVAFESGRIMLQRLRQLASERHDFGFESTLASRTRLGGHDVPEETVRRRSGRSLTNLFELYLPLADEWTAFDNSGAGESQPIASHSAPDGIDDESVKIWRRLQRIASHPTSRH